MIVLSSLSQTFARASIAAMVMEAETPKKLSTSRGTRERVCKERRAVPWRDSSACNVTIRTGAEQSLQVKVHVLV